MVAKRVVKAIMPEVVRRRGGNRLVEICPRGLLRLLERAIDFPIPRYLRQSKCLFIHVPKNAGISISQALYGVKVPHRAATFYLASDPEFFASRIKAALVRNPWDRAVSAYEFYRAGGGADTKVSRAKAPPASAVTSFRHFIFDYLVPNKDRLNELDNALHEQYPYLEDEAGNCLIDVLGRYEDIPAFVSVLRDRGLLKSELGYFNRTLTRDGADYHDYYSDQEIVDAVANCYANDVKRYDYSF